MKAVTLDAIPQYVFEQEPEWSSGITGTFTFQADVVPSLVKREQRRALGETLRVDLSASFFLNGAEAAEARNVMRILQDTPVRLPFWPGLGDVGANFEGRWYMAFDESTDGSPGGVENLYWTNGAGDLNGRSEIVASLLGYLIEAPKFEELSSELFKVDVKWRESSARAEALQLAAVDWTAGPPLGAQTVYLFPFTPDFQGTQDAGAVSVEVDRQSIGFSRSYSNAAYPQLGCRQPRFIYTLESQQDVATLLRFFQDMQGNVGVFWLPCWVGECRLAVDAAAGDSTVTVTDATALGDQRYVQFLAPTGAVVVRRVTGIAGNVLTLDSAVGVALAAEATLFCTLALARFAGADLTIGWTGPDFAQAEIAFVEVTQEYSTPLGETLGETLGALPAICYLYQLVSAGLTWRWTSYEKDLDYGGNVWSAVAIEHDAIVDGMAWDSANSTITMRSWPGNPVLGLMNRTTTDRLQLTIYSGTPGDPVTSVAALFQGWITKAEFKGAFITADAEAFGSLFSRQVPRTIMQTGDNYALFDAGNRLVKADWTFTARLTAVVGLELTMDTWAWPGGALPALTANYFALGYVERPAGATFERVPIISSTVIAAGVLTVTIAHGFMQAAPAPPEVGWKIVPGYDGLWATAVAKFGNGVNFGGFPQIPDTNPSLVALPVNTATSTKK